jgi:hypothetical protein
MHCKKIDNDFQFTTPSIDGVCVVKFIYTDEEEEKLTTVLPGIECSFRPRDLEPGTIKKVIGEKSWERFLRMKQKGISDMFLNPRRPVDTGATCAKMTS